MLNLLFESLKIINYTKMKRVSFRFAFYLLLFSAFAASSCNKPSPTPVSDKNGIFTLKFNITAGGQPLVLNKTIVNANGQHYNLNELHFYVSNPQLNGSNNQPLTDILLIDPDKTESVFNSAKVGTVFSFPVMAGTYTSLSFGLGPTKIQNGAWNNSSNLPPHSNFDPLSDSYNTFWNNHLGYLFFMTDGLMDTTVNNSGQTNFPFEYHCGLDTMFRSKTFSDKTITITAGVTDTFTIHLEVDSIFNSINMKKNYDTHTTDNIVLAIKLMNNFAAAITD